MTSLFSAFSITAGQCSLCPRGLPCPFLCCQVLHRPCLWLDPNLLGPCIPDSSGLIQADEFTGPWWSILWPSARISTCSQNSKMGLKGKYTVYRSKKKNTSSSSFISSSSSKFPGAQKEMERQRTSPSLPSQTTPIPFHYSSADSTERLSGETQALGLPSWVLVLQISASAQAHAASGCSIQLYSEPIIRKPHPLKTAFKVTLQIFSPRTTV